MLETKNEPDKQQGELVENIEGKLETATTIETNDKVNYDELIGLLDQSIEEDSNRKGPEIMDRGTNYSDDVAEPVHNTT